MAVGTRRWSLATGGLLSRTARLSLYRQMLKAQMADIAARIAGMGFWRKPSLDVDVSSIPVPDSAMARAAEEFAADVYGRALNLHCLRTYFWGALLGKADAIQTDLELFYVASLLHDLGLADPHIREAQSCCFAVTGAREAEAFVRRHGWDDARAHAVFEAISLHLNLDVSAKQHGAEARLLACGAQLDVVGARVHRLSRRTIESTLKAYPRDGFVGEILELMDTPHHPDSRSAFLENIGFRKRAVSNPLDSTV